MTTLQVGLFDARDDYALVQASDSRWVRLRRERVMWFNPLTFVDHDDLFPSKHNAYAFFQDMLVSRPTEFKALLYLFARAFGNLDSAGLNLTQRQQQAVNLAREAVGRGVHPTGYVAQRLHISGRAVRALLSNANKRTEYCHSDDFFHVCNDDTITDWTPTAAQIKVKMATLPRVCAGSSPHCEGSVRGDYALCYPCYRYFGVRGEWVETTRKWLEPEVRRIEREHRKAAIDALYAEHLREQSASIPWSESA